MAIKWFAEKCLGVFSIVVLMLFSSSISHAFIFIRGGVYVNKGERPAARAPLWAGRTVNFQINTDTTVYGGGIVAELTGAEFQTAVTQAVNSWASVCGSDIVVNLSGTTASLKVAGDGINAIVWDNRTTGGGNVIANVSTLAAAYSNVSAGDVYSDCDIVVNGEASGTFGIGGESGKYDLVGILAHEIGHCLGLDHTVEPPTWSSSNTILNTATMNAFVSLGDLDPRSISQDETDAMECVNPTGRGARAGFRCASYHGTNGNGGLTGVVTGGPSSTVSCGVGTSSSVTGSTVSGGGCITKAFAGDERHSKRAILSSWFVEMAILCSFYFLVVGVRRLRRGRGLMAIFFAASAGLFLSSTPAQAVTLSASGEYRWMKPTRVGVSRAIFFGAQTLSRRKTGGG